MVTRALTIDAICMPSTHSVVLTHLFCEFITTHSELLIVKHHTCVVTAFITAKQFQARPARGREQPRVLLLFFVTTCIRSRPVSQRSIENIAHRIAPPCKD